MTEFKDQFGDNETIKLHLQQMTEERDSLPFYILKLRQEMGRYVRTHLNDVEQWLTV